MKTLNKLFIFTLILSTHLLNSQNEFSKWYFGIGPAGLDFSTNPPTILSNGASPAGTSGGCATISDNTGNLMFYTNATTVFNSAHVAMANGTGINATNGSSQTVIIVKQPGNANLYYVFTTKGGFVLAYSIVDMSLAAGMGSVTVKNAVLDQPTCNKLLAVRHCNGKDAWIISHDASSNKFKSFLLDNNGVSSTPIVSALGPGTPSINGLNNGGMGGYLKISPDGKKLAMAQFTNSVPTSDGPEGFYLFDFDPASGVVSNSLQLNQASAAYGVEFSPDGKKLYGVMNGAYNTSANTLLYQWDLCAGSNSAIAASQYSFVLGTNNSYGSGTLQRAIDGKIYLTATPTATAASYSISVINSPNSSGAAMNFVMNGQLVGSGTRKPAQGLPNYINSYTKPVMPAVSKTVACQTVNFTVPTPTFAGGCSANSYPINSYLWDFGDVSSGSANTSTLNNPSHLFSALGTYTVKTILYSNCTNDTLLSVVSINSLSPVVSVIGNSVICKGDKRAYIASGASSYSWSTGATTASVNLSPSATSAYTVTGTTNGCKTSKVFTLTVEPCTGLSSNSNNSKFQLYPNPFTNELFIDCEEASDVLIIDITGRTVVNTNIQKGTNTLSTENLKPGLYFVQCSVNETVTRFRIVKGE